LVRCRRSSSRLHEHDTRIRGRWDVMPSKRHDRGRGATRSTRDGPSAVSRQQGPSPSPEPRSQARRGALRNLDPARRVVGIEVAVHHRIFLARGNMLFRPMRHGCAEGFPSRWRGVDARTKAFVTRDMTSRPPLIGRPSTSRSERPKITLLRLFCRPKADADRERAQQRWPRGFWWKVHAPAPSDADHQRQQETYADLG